MALSDNHHDSNQRSRKKTNLFTIHSMINWLGHADISLLLKLPSDEDSSLAWPAGYLVKAQSLVVEAFATLQGHMQKRFLEQKVANKSNWRGRSLQKNKTVYKKKKKK